MPFDAEIAAAKEAIKENGMLVKWRTIDAVVPADPATPWKPTQPEAPVEHDAWIAFFPFGSSKKTKRKGKDGDVEIGDEFGLMGAVDFEISTKDVVIRNGKELRIAAIDTLAPDGNPILHTIEFAL